MSSWLIGTHAIRAALSAGRRRVSNLYCVNSKSLDPALLKLAASRRVPVVPLPLPELLRRTGLSREDLSSGMALEAGDYPYEEVTIFSDEGAESRAFLLALDQVQDPHNCGALLRSAYAFGVRGVILSKDQSVAITDAVVRSSAGASEYLSIARVAGLPQILRNLKQKGYWIVGAAAGGTPISECTLLAEPLVLVMGAEGQGLRETTQKSCDLLVSIPMKTHTAFDSLNVSVAGGVLMWEIAKARRA